MSNSVDLATSSNLWCILRTSGARTLRLERSLVGAGFEAWTPKEGQSRKRPRSSSRIDVVVPIAPTFVFVRAERLADVARALAQPVSPHPPFSIFQHAGRIPLVREAALASLRAAEEKAARREKRSHRYIYPRGAKVKTDEPAFVGLTGVVEDGDGKHAVVTFGGSFRMKIATWLLRADDVSDAQSSDIAA